MFAPLAAVAGALLAAFHLWLLGQQAWTGQLEYAATLRWLLAFALVGGFVTLHRRGASLWDRRVTALWVLAAVLHGPALAGDQGPAAPVLAETSNAAIQIAGAALGLALAVTLGRVARAWQPPRDWSAAATRPVPVVGPRLAVFGDGFLPRPPPVG